MNPARRDSLLVNPDGRGSFILMDIKTTITLVLSSQMIVRHNEALLCIQNSEDSCLCSTYVVHLYLKQLKRSLTDRDKHNDWERQ